MAILALCWVVVHGLWVASGDVKTLSEWTYDDAYYYFVTAHHLATKGVSTFDGGRTLHSGYHFLWMAICTVDALVFGELSLPYLRSLIVLSLLISTAVIAVVSVVFIKARDWAGALTLCVMLTSYSVLNNSISAMEWPAVVAIGVGYCFALLSLDRMALRRAVFLALLLGFLGSWARTDFGLFLGSFWLATLLLRRSLGAQWRSRFIFVTAAVLGAVVGLVALCGVNMLMTGQLLQTSVRMKSLYSLGGLKTSPLPVMWQFARALFYLPPLQVDQNAKQGLLDTAQRVVIGGFGTFVAFAVILLSVPRARSGLLRIRHKLANVTTEVLAEWRLPMLASILGLVGYIAIYSLDASAVFGWYTANVSVFVFFLTYAFFRIASGIVRPLALVLLGVVVAVVNIVALAQYGGTAAEQYVYVEVGRYMRDARERGLTTGAGDAGKIGFIAGGQVINLDGLVNDDIFSYVSRGSLHCYLLDAKVDLFTSFGQAGRSNDAVRRLASEPERFAADYTYPTDDPHVHRVRFDVLRSYPECATKGGA